MPRLLAMKAEWRENPPVPLMIKAYLGIEGSNSSDKKAILPGLLTEPDIEE